MTRRIRVLCVFIILAIFSVCLSFIFKDKIIAFVKNNFTRTVYQIEFAEEVEKASKEFGVSKEIIYAVIKTESNFNSEAVSSAGALGLMQLMPETYSWISLRLGEKDDVSLITDPLINIRYGTYYLSFLFERFDNEETVYAAYNAGYSRVKGWLSDSRYSTNGKSLDSIPYEETSAYVEKVCDAKIKYKTLLDESAEK